MQEKIPTDALFSYGSLIATIVNTIINNNREKKTKIIIIFKYLRYINDYR